jgi:hypothetical protein
VTFNKFRVILYDSSVILHHFRGIIYDSSVILYDPRVSQNNSLYDSVDHKGFQGEYL